MEPTPKEKKDAHIILPDGMSKEQAIVHLQRKIVEDETKVKVNEIIDTFVFDGALAFQRVLNDHFGWVNLEAKMGFFGPNLPQTIALEVSHKKYESVFWGQFSVPGVDGTFETGVHKKDGHPVFCINGTVRRKHLHIIEMIAEKTRRFLEKNSVYRGKAIRIAQNSEGVLNWMEPPTFLDLSQVDPDQLIFEDDLAEQVKTSVFTPIEHTTACRQSKIPLKRGILLAGPYGTGKTLTATVTAKKCEENGWTFIYLPKVEGLHEAISLASRYSPAVVFAEDVDSVMGNGRDESVNEILNTIDGVDGKNSEIMVILSSNNAERIEKAMLRPGRLDSVICFTPPDARAAERLLRRYGGDLIADDEDLTGAARVLAGEIPAVIREVVERSKLFALSRSDGHSLQLTAEDFERAGKGMQEHLKLLRGEVAEPTPAETLAESLGSVVKKAFNGSAEKLSAIHERVCEK